MGEVEMFLPADQRYTRPYARVTGLDGLAVWYAWSSETTGWIALAGAPRFELRRADSIERLDLDQSAPREGDQ